MKVLQTFALPLGYCAVLQSEVCGARKSLAGGGGLGASHVTQFASFYVIDKAVDGEGVGVPRMIGVDGRTKVRRLQRLGYNGQQRQLGADVARGARLRLGVRRRFRWRCGG